MDKLRSVYKIYVNMSIVAKAAFWFTLCSFAQQGVSIITTPIFTRLLSTEDYGVWTIYQTWQSLLSVFVTLNLAGGGFGNAMLKFKDDQNAFISSTVGLAFTLSAVWGIILLVGKDFFTMLIGLPSSYLLVMIAELFFRIVFSLWAGQQRFNYLYRALLIVTLGTTIFSQLFSAIVVYYSINRLDTRVYTNAGLICFVYLFLLIAILLKGKCVFKKKYWKYMLLFNFALIPHYLSQIVLNQADRIMIEQLCGASYAAMYSVSYTVANIMTLLLTGVASALSPWMARRLKNRDYEGINKIISSLGIFFCTVSIVPILVGPEAIAVLAPKEYQAAIWVIPPVSGCIYFLFLYNMFSIVQFYYEKKAFIALSSIFIAIANIILNYIFIKQFGFIAAGYTTVICYILYSLVNYIFLRKVMHENKVCDNLYNFKFLFTVGGVVVVVTFVSNFLYLNNIVRYVFLLGLGVSAFIRRKDIVKLLVLIRRG